MGLRRIFQGRISICLNSKTSFMTIVYTKEELVAEAKRRNGEIKGRKLFVDGEVVMEYHSPQWGGARGGGRPATDRTTTLCVKISKEAMDKLNNLTNNKSKYIDDLIMAQ